MGRAESLKESMQGQDAAALDKAGRSERRGGDDAGLSIDEAEERGDESTPLEYNIFSMPADYTLETLHQKWRNGDIVIPKFQRGYVWKAPQASKLIESFMVGLPVPPVFLARYDEGRSVVIDGMQRLGTVFAYLDGAYPEDSDLKGEKFQIVGINKGSRLYGKTFLDLGEDDQRRLRDSVLRATIVMRNGPMDDDSGIYEIFERLNTGGTSLEAQEVRNCVYRGGLPERGRYCLNEAWDVSDVDRDIEQWAAVLAKARVDSPQIESQIARFLPVHVRGRHERVADELVGERARKPGDLPPASCVGDACKPRREPRRRCPQDKVPGKPGGRRREWFKDRVSATARENCDSPVADRNRSAHGEAASASIGEVARRHQDDREVLRRFAEALSLPDSQRAKPCRRRLIAGRRTAL